MFTAKLTGLEPSLDFSNALYLILFLFFFFLKGSQIAQASGPTKSGYIPGKKNQVPSVKEPVRSPHLLPLRPLCTPPRLAPPPKSVPLQAWSAQVDLGGPHLHSAGGFRGALLIYSVFPKGLRGRSTTARPFPPQASLRLGAPPREAPGRSHAGRAGGIGSYLLDGCKFTSSLKIITSSSVIHKTKFQCPGTEEGPGSSGHFSFTPCAPAVLKCPRPGHPLMSWSLELSGLQLEASFTQSDRHLPLSAHQHAQLHTRDMASGYPGPTPPHPRAPLLQADGGTSAAEHLPLAKCVH